MKIEKVEIGKIEEKVKTEALERATPEEEEEEEGKSDPENGQPATPSIPQRSRFIFNV